MGGVCSIFFQTSNDKGQLTQELEFLAMVAVASPLLLLIVFAWEKKGGGRKQGKEKKRENLN
jgi:hypothetical protein